MPKSEVQVHPLVVGCSETTSSPPSFSFSQHWGPTMFCILVSPLILLICSQHRSRLTGVPGFLHGLLGQVNVPVGQVEEREGHWEENAGVFVDGAGAGQARDRRKRRALLEENRQLRGISWVTARDGVVPPLHAFQSAAVHLKTTDTTKEGG